MSAITLLLGTILIVFAVLKIQEPASTYKTMQYLFNLPHGAYLLILVVLVGLELAVGYALFVRWKPRVTLLVSISLLVMFSAVIVKLLLDPNAPSCGCSGSLALLDDARLSNWIALGRNVVMIALAYVGWLCAAPVAGDEAILPDGISESPTPA